MIIDDMKDPIPLQSGVYKHYKGPLYQVVGYSHNASDANNVQVLYISLEIDPSKTGPRWSTRDWRDFFATVCPVHDGTNAYSDEHDDLVRDNIERTCDPLEWKERFEYMGPVYYKGYEG